MTSELYLNKAILYKTPKPHTCRAPHFQPSCGSHAGFIWPPSLRVSSFLGPGLPPSPLSAPSGTCRAPPEASFPGCAPSSLRSGRPALCAAPSVCDGSPPTPRQVGAAAECPPDSYRPLNHATPPTESLFGCLPPRMAGLAMLAPPAFFVASGPLTVLTSDHD